MRSSLIILCVSLTLIKCSSDQNATSKIVNGYVKYIGGNEDWKKVNTLVTYGEYDYGSIKFPFTSYSKGPNLYKFIVPFHGKYYAQAFDGVKGWKIDAFKNETKPTLLSGSAALAMANESDVYLMNEFLRSDYSDCKLVADTTVDQHLCHQLTEGPVLKWFFDKENEQLVAKKSIAKNPELQGAILFTHYSDYRKEGDIKIPFKIIHETNGQTVLTITVEKVTINAEIKDSEFQP